MDNSKYKFKQIQTGLLAFIGNFELKLQEIVPNIPVLVLNTGDDSYYLNSKFESAEKEVYQKVPRFVFEFGDLQFQTDQDTSQYNKIQYNFNDVNFIGSARRKALQVDLSSFFVCSNYVKALEYFEVISSILIHDNVFTYEWMGNTYEGSYAQTTSSIDKNSSDVSSGSKNNVIRTSIELVLQLMIFRYESIKKTDDTEINSVKISITVDNNIVDHNTELVLEPKILTSAQRRLLKSQEK